MPRRTRVSSKNAKGETTFLGKDEPSCTCQQCVKVKTDPKDQLGIHVRIYTSDEVMGLPKNKGWFYGLVSYNGDVFIAEIYPGFGFSTLTFPELNKCVINRAMSDIIAAGNRKILPKKKPKWWPY